ncbi:hypothetical protein IM876_09100 [Serratia plymuthica]|uniref:hypothetical protein n=1 Tax=Serratia plymuthica TaxID=82996 RepID=UPI001927E3AB|nr:hypothetical protein [Serratia plymuthica]MBL3522819.1 hypothetical protein [Serratia plymuthica]
MSARINDELAPTGELKRYQPDFSYESGLPGMFETTNGGYVSITDHEALKADRDAQQKRSDALAVENAALRVAVDGFNEELYGKGFEVLGWHLNGATEPLDNWFGDNDWNPETPATSAALAAIEAQGVEKAAVKMQESGAQTFGDCYIALVQYAAELREGK